MGQDFQYLELEIKIRNHSKWYVTHLLFDQLLFLGCLVPGLCPLVPSQHVLFYQSGLIQAHSWVWSLTRAPFVDQHYGCSLHPAVPANLLTCPCTTSLSVQQEHFGTFQSIWLHHVWHLAMQTRNRARMLLHFFFDSCSLIWHKVLFSLLTFT